MTRWVGNEARQTSEETGELLCASLFVFEAAAAAQGSSTLTLSLFGIVQWVDGTAAAPAARGGGGMVRVMSYNILADQLAHAHRAELYAAVPAPLLHWPTRMSALVRSPIPN